MRPGGGVSALRQLQIGDHGGVVGAFHRKYLRVGDLQALREDVVDAKEPRLPIRGAPGPGGLASLPPRKRQGRIHELFCQPAVERPNGCGVEVSRHDPMGCRSRLQVRQEGMTLGAANREGAPRRPLGVGGLKVKANDFDHSFELGPILRLESHNAGRSVGQGEGLDLAWIAQGDTVPVVIVTRRQFAVRHDAGNGLGLSGHELLKTGDVDLLSLQELHDGFRLGIAVKQIRRHYTQLRTQTRSAFRTRESGAAQRRASASRFNRSSSLSSFATRFASSSPRTLFGTTMGSP